MINSLGKKTQLYSDRGFVGIKNIITNPISMQSIKKSKNNPLRKRDQTKNRQINKKRVKIEHVFALMKNYARMTDPYNGSIDEFRAEFNTVTGIVDLNIMWKKLRRKYKPDESWQTYFE